MTDWKLERISFTPAAHILTVEGFCNMAFSTTHTITTCACEAKAFYFTSTVIKGSWQMFIDTLTFSSVRTAPGIPSKVFICPMAVWRTLSQAATSCRCHWSEIINLITQEILMFGAFWFETIKMQSLLVAICETFCCGKLESTWLQFKVWVLVFLTLSFKNDKG